jgi:hypothetical protein
LGGRNGRPFSLEASMNENVTNLLLAQMMLSPRRPDRAQPRWSEEYRWPADNEFLPCRSGKNWRSSKGEDSTTKGSSGFATYLKTSEMIAFDAAHQ